MELETPVRSYEGVTTESIVIEMLTENTGKHFLDSGGAYGRHWERNQGRDFASEPEVSYEFSAWRKGGEGPGTADLSATVSLYHWMVNNLELDVGMQQRLDLFEVENPELSYMQLQEDFAELEAQRFEHDKAPNCVNTYNGGYQNDLSQVLQFHELYTDGDYEPTHLVISVHGGCDVRGGYGAPKCFKLEGEYYEVMDRARASEITAGDHYWSYQSGTSGPDAESMGAPVPCILKAPCYDIDWVESEQIREFEVLITRSVRVKSALSSTSLTPEQQTLAAEEIDATVKELEEEVFDAVLAQLTEMHDVCTVVRDKKLYLVQQSDIGPFAEEVKVYNV